jgi:hypothetical protein
MKRFLDASRRISLATGRALALAWAATLKWLAVPVNLCLALIGLAFVVSFGAWAIGDPFEAAVLFFPDARGRLHGELREIPHSRGAEARAELIAAELLLGPKASLLSSAFEPGVKVEAAIYRKGRLFLDISPEAALANPASLKNGITAMDRSLKAALPGLKRLSLTIGGKEPYAVGLKAEGGKGIKKTGK